MSGHLNVEIKARSENHDQIRLMLCEQGAEYKGLDHQIDTYFKVERGRLKLREGTIEKNLIFYERDDQEGPKESKVILYPFRENMVVEIGTLKEILTRTQGVLAVVDKQREIYFVDNVKFHLDVVADLGRFVEIEAIDLRGDIGRERLLEQCTRYMNLFQIRNDDLVSKSYSDMLLERR